MTHPDLVLIGESDRRAGDVVEAIHPTFIANNAPVRRMTWVNAEITSGLGHRCRHQKADPPKIAVNTFVTTKISYVNMLAGLCEQLRGTIDGASVRASTAAAGSNTVTDAQATLNRRPGSFLQAGHVRASSLAESVEGVDVLVLMVPWPEFVTYQRCCAGDRRSRRRSLTAGACSLPQRTR